MRIISLFFVAFPALGFLASCQTDSSAWKGESSWTFIPAPPEVGARAHSLCGSSEDVFVAFGGIEEGRELPFSSSLVLYHERQNIWDVADESQAPPARNFAALALMDQKVFIFGGETARKTETADAHVFNRDDGSWNPLPSAGDLQPRKQATITKVGDELVVFGGKGSREITNWARYHPQQKQWHVHPLAPGMSSRVAHVAYALDDSRLLIWGGFEGARRSGDGFILDVRAQTIDSLPGNPALTPRANAKILGFGDHILIWGGASPNGMSNSGAILNVKTRQWTPVPGVPDSRLDGLQGAAIAPLGNQGFLLHGGRLGTDAFHDRTWLFDRVTHRWTLIRTNEGPVGRMAHCFVALGPNRFAVWGGIGYRKGTRSLTQLDGLWILDLK